MPHSHVLSDPSSLSHSPALCASFIRHYGHRQVMPNLHIIFLVDRSSSLLCSLFVYSYLRISKAHRAHILGRSSIEFSVNSKYGAASCCARWHPNTIPLIYPNPVIHVVVSAMLKIIFKLVWINCSTMTCSIVSHHFLDKYLKGPTFSIPTHARTLNIVYLETEYHRCWLGWFSSLYSLCESVMASQWWRIVLLRLLCHHQC